MLFRIHISIRRVYFRNVGKLNSQSVLLEVYRRGGNNDRVTKLVKAPSRNVLCYYFQGCSLEAFGIKSYFAATQLLWFVFSNLRSNN